MSEPLPRRPARADHALHRRRRRDRHDALAAIVDRLVAAGVGGLVPGGSTGEFTTLDHAERRRLVEDTVEAAAGRVPVVAGTGALSTRETVALSVHAEQAGAAAVMIVPPFYDALPWRELLVHYTAVADAIEIPIMYYNLPSASGVTLTAAQLARAARDAASRTPAATRPRHRADPDRTARRCSTATTRSRSPRSPPASAPSYGAPPRSSPSSASSCTACSSTTSTSRPRASCGPPVAALPFLESNSYPAAVKTACGLAGDTTGPVRAAAAAARRRVDQRARRPPRARDRGQRARVTRSSVRATSGLCGVRHTCRCSKGHA